MKQNIVLWISAAVITFLVVFIQNRTSPNYPISGTIGINGHKVSYFFEKIHRVKSDYNIMMRTDLSDLTGIIKWKELSENHIWYTDTMKYSSGILEGIIPKQNPNVEVVYSVNLSYKGKKYLIPNEFYQRLLFIGIVPTSIIIHYYLTLLIGLLVAFRSGLEIFNSRPRLRLYAIFTLISFFSCAMIFAPVKKAYELGVIGKAVPPIRNIFELWLVVLVVVWILTLILISFTPNSRKWILLSSFLTLFIYISQNF